MNMQPRYTRDELDLMLQEPFATSRRIPGIVQEEIAKRWMAGIPPEFSKHSGGKYARKHAACVASTEAIARKTQARLANAGQEILPLHHEGKGAPEISRITTFSPNFIRRVIREAGLVPNHARPARHGEGYAKILDRVHSLRMDGMSWVDISKAVCANKTSLRNAYNEWRDAK